MEWRLGADFSDQVDLLWINKCLIFILVVLFSDADPSKTGSLLSQVSDNSSSVNTSNGWDAFSRAPLAQAFDGGPVRVFLCHIRDDHANSLNVGTFEVLIEPVLISVAGRDTIVPNQRLGKDQDLAPIRWIGEGLGIADERSSKHGFA